MTRGRVSPRLAQRVSESRGHVVTTQKPSEQELGLLTIVRLDSGAPVRKTPRPPRIPGFTRQDVQKSGVVLLSFLSALSKSRGFFSKGRHGALTANWGSAHDPRSPARSW